VVYVVQAAPVAVRYSIVATPGPLPSSAVMVTDTGPLFHPLLLATGDCDDATVGFVVSFCTVTELLGALAAVQLPRMEVTTYV
jgi:hypothetical protein